MRDDLALPSKPGRPPIHILPLGQLQAIQDAEQAQGAAVAATMALQLAVTELRASRRGAGIMAIQLAVDILQNQGQKALL